jgi:hypothetical protein
MILRWRSRYNEYGTSLVTSLLKHIRSNEQATETGVLETGISFAVLP